MVGKISKLEQQNEGHEKRLEKLEVEAKSIPRLETLMEMVVETNKEQSDTMSKVNDNLTKLNGKMDSLDSRVGELEDSKKETKKLTMDGIFKIVTGLVLAYLVYKFGIK